MSNVLAFFLKAFSGADEVFPDSHNSSVPTRAHVRVHANYIMYVISHPFSQDNKNYAL